MIVWVFMIGYDLSVASVKLTNVAGAQREIDRLAGTPSKIVVAEEWNVLTSRCTGRKLTSPEAED